MSYTVPVISLVIAIVSACVFVVSSAINFGSDPVPKEPESKLEVGWAYAHYNPGNSQRSKDPDEPPRTPEPFYGISIITEIRGDKVKSQNICIRPEKEGADRVRIYDHWDDADWFEHLSFPRIR